MEKLKLGVIFGGMSTEHNVSVVSANSIIESLNKRLADTQVLDGEVGVIDTENTIIDFKNGTFGTNKALSISKNGKLVINFIVKSNKINYNDSIELN